MPPSLPYRSLHSGSVPQELGWGPWVPSDCRRVRKLPAGSLIVCDVCVYMCVAGWGCSPDVPPLSAQVPPPPNGPSLRLRSGGRWEPCTEHRRLRSQSRAPRSAPGPSARFFVAGPPRSIAPSPSGHSKVTRERAGGGAAPGDPRPGGLHPSRPAALPARLLLARVRAPGTPPLLFPFCVSLISTLSVGANWYLFLCSSHFPSLSHSPSPSV